MQKNTTIKEGVIMDFGIAGVAAITVLAYLIGQGVKASGLANKWIPVIWNCGPGAWHRGSVHHAGFPGGRSYHGGGDRRCVWLCGYGHKSDC